MIELEICDLMPSLLSLEVFEGGAAKKCREKRGEIQNVKSFNILNPCQITLP